MALVVGAMATGIPAPREIPGEVSGQQISWDGKTVKQLKFALAEARGLRATGFFSHIVQVTLQVNDKNSSPS